jgi:3-deoxy-D-manno-octulosonate 8-phosphate phosphatase KdsC-like HAD superfamily phosphatase
VFELIAVLSRFYNSDGVEMELWMNVIYAGMIAEENKENAILKKRIKRLGVHQVLIDNISPEKAAVFSKGKKWKELDEIMRMKGF